MKEYRDIYAWIDAQKKTMQDLVIQWSAINTHTFNLKGLESLSREVKSVFSVFNEEIREVSLPPFEGEG